MSFVTRGNSGPDVTVMCHVHGAAHRDRRKNVVTGVILAGYAILFHVRLHHSTLMMLVLNDGHAGFREVFNPRHRYRKGAEN
jgi:hypothetical protein